MSKSYPSPLMGSRDDGFELTVVRCIWCQHCWVRRVPVGALDGHWLCPRGWGLGCPSDTWERAPDRLDVLTVYILSGEHGFGDMRGAPPRG